VVCCRGTLRKVEPTGSTPGSSPAWDLPPAPQPLGATDHLPAQDLTRARLMRSRCAASAERAKLIATPPQASGSTSCIARSLSSGQTWGAKPVMGYRRTDPKPTTTETGPYRLAARPMRSVLVRYRSYRLTDVGTHHCRFGLRLLRTFTARCVLSDHACANSGRRDL